MVPRKQLAICVAVLGGCLWGGQRAPAQESGVSGEEVRRLLEALRPVAVGAEPLGIALCGGSFRYGVLSGTSASGWVFQCIDGGGVYYAASDRWAMPALRPAKWSDLQESVKWSDLQESGSPGYPQLFRSAGIPISMQTRTMLILSAKEAAAPLVSTEFAKRAIGGDAWILLVYSATIRAGQWRDVMAHTDDWIRLFPEHEWASLVREQRNLMGRGVTEGLLDVQLPDWTEGSRGLELGQADDGWLYGSSDSSYLGWLRRAVVDVGAVWEARNDDRPTRCCVWTGDLAQVARLMTVGELARYVLQCASGLKSDGRKEFAFERFVAAAAKHSAKDESWRILKSRGLPKEHDVRLHLDLWPDDIEKVCARAPVAWGPSLGAVATAVVCAAPRPLGSLERGWLASAFSSLGGLEAMVVAERLRRDGLADQWNQLRKTALDAKFSDHGLAAYLMGVDVEFAGEWLKNNKASDLPKLVFALALFAPHFRRCGLSGNPGEWESCAVESLKSIEKACDIRWDGPVPVSWEFDLIERLNGHMAKRK